MGEGDWTGEQLKPSLPSRHVYQYVPCKRRWRNKTQSSRTVHALTMLFSDSFPISRTRSQRVAGIKAPGLSECWSLLKSARHLVADHVLSLHWEDNPRSSRFGGVAHHKFACPKAGSFAPAHVPRTTIALSIPGRL